MNLRNIVWTAVVATVAGLAGLIVALVTDHTDIVVALAGISIASSFLSSREN